MKNRILAIPAAVPAMPVKPSSPAASATPRKIRVHPSMCASLWVGLLAVSRFLDGFVDLLAGVLGRTIVVEGFLHAVDRVVDLLAGALGGPLRIDLLADVFDRFVDGLSGLFRGPLVRATGQDEERNGQQQRQKADLVSHDVLLCIRGFQSSDAKRLRPSVLQSDHLAYISPRVSRPHAGRVMRTGWRRQPSQTRALRNMRAHGESSPSPSGAQLICTVRKLRSGCGIMIVKRPSGVVKPVRPPAEPLGLAGYFSATAPRLST